jgi:hypothetical protein
MNYKKIIRELVALKFEQDNQIDLNAYELGMIDLKKQFSLHAVSQRSELLPEFLMHDLDGKIITSVIGSADVTKEWNEYLGNCG